MRTVQRCMALAQLLIEQNFPAIAIHRQMKQEERYVIYLTFSFIVYTIVLCQVVSVLGFQRFLEAHSCFN